MKAPSVSPHILDHLAMLQRTPDPATPKAQARTKRKPKADKTGRKKKPVLPPESLRQAFAHEAIRCTALYTIDQPDELIQHSAAFLEALVALWAERRIDEQDVWREIDHRLQLGNLLTQINQDTPQVPMAKRRFWRPSSTKLP